MPSSGNCARYSRYGPFPEPWLLVGQNKSTIGYITSFLCPCQLLVNTSQLSEIWPLISLYKSYIGEIGQYKSSGRFSVRGQVPAPEVPLQYRLSPGFFLYAWPPINTVLLELTE